MDWDEPVAKSAKSAVIGENLELFSVAELEARLQQLEAEIDRVKKEHDRKVQIAASADQIFKT